MVGFPWNEFRIPNADAAASRRSGRQGKPLPRDVRNLIKYYEVEGTPLAAYLERWVEDTRPGWRTRYLNVTLRVLPFSAKPVFSTVCVYALFGYKDAGESIIVCNETHAGFLSAEDVDQVKKYRGRHGALMRASLQEEESRSLIRSTRDAPRNCMSNHAVPGAVKYRSLINRRPSLLVG